MHPIQQFSDKKAGISNTIATYCKFLLDILVQPKEKSNSKILWPGSRNIKYLRHQGQKIFVTCDEWSFPFVNNHLNGRKLTMPWIDFVSISRPSSKNLGSIYKGHVVQDKQIVLTRPDDIRLRTLEADLPWPTEPWRRDKHLHRDHPQPGSRPEPGGSEEGWSRLSCEHES